MRGGRKLKAVIPGGSSMPVLPGEVMLDLTWTTTRCRRPAPAGLGRGDRDGRHHLHGAAPARISRFYYAESCGQCTPCREGTGWMYRMLTASSNGRARWMTSTCSKQAAAEPDRRPHHLRLRRGRGLAGAGLRAHFRHEFEYYIEHGGA
jgi:NADH-quinone oxidoreductase subunit F